MQIYVADSIEMCLYRFSGTAAGAALGALVMLVIPRNDFSIGLALFLTIGLCSFLTRYRTRYRMAAITVAIIMITGIDADNILIFAMFRVLEIFIGILCSFVVSVLIFPRKRLDALSLRLVQQAETCSSLCSQLVDAFLDGQQKVPENLADALVKDAWANHTLLQKVHHHEALIYQAQAGIDFQGRNSLINCSAEHLRNMVRTLNARTDQGYDIIMADELRSLAQKSCDILCRVMADQPVPDIGELENMLSALDVRLIHIRKEGAIRRFDSKKLIQIFSFYSSLQYFAEDILSGARKLSTEF